MDLHKETDASPITLQPCNSYYSTPPQPGSSKRGYYVAICASLGFCLLLLGAAFPADQATSTASLAAFAPTRGLFAGRAVTQRKPHTTSVTAPLHVVSPKFPRAIERLRLRHQRAAKDGKAENYGPRSEVNVPLESENLRPLNEAVSQESESEKKILWPHLLSIFGLVAIATKLAVVAIQQRTQSMKVTADETQALCDPTMAMLAIDNSARPKMSTKELIAEAQKENVRQNREMFEVPKLTNTDKFWDFRIWPRKLPSLPNMCTKDKIVLALVSGIHAGALLAPLYYSPQALLVFFVGYMITGFGITLSYHRQLTHRSFVTPKWLEYIFAYCGIMAVQGDPIEWVSAHRHHHAHCDTEVDPHSPYDGVFWSHMGWLLDVNTPKILADESNAADMAAQPFYQWIKNTYPLHIAIQPIVLYMLGGMPWVVYGFFLRTVWVWHITWAVNSISHIWGFQSWKTGDISMNNWLVGIAALGEGWHNNHHAFEDSCRHGLEWWQWDPTWYLIWALEKVGLANKLRYPSESRMAKLAI